MATDAEALDTIVLTILSCTPERRGPAFDELVMHFAEGLRAEQPDAPIELFILFVAEFHAKLKLRLREVQLCGQGSC